jgi:hypothetical protein
MGRFIVWGGGHQSESNGLSISARDAPTAAEEWTAFHNILEPVSVWVRNLDDGGSVHEWMVSSETTRHYTARLRFRR